MSELLPGLWRADVLLALAWLALAGSVLTLILVAGRSIGRRLNLRLWGVPEALVAGILGLLVAPSGPLPLLPQHLMELWGELPLVLLTLVFGSLMLGKPLPKLGGLWRPVCGQVSLALVLAFGQYVVGGLAVLLVLQPWLGVSPVMACLIEVAYEGGHGSAAAMGPSYAALGFPGGQALGLAMATVGLLSSTLVGGLVVVLARSRGWLLADAPGSAASESASAASGQSVVRIDSPNVLGTRTATPTGSVLDMNAGVLAAGLIVAVPLFVVEGDVLKIDTRTGEYVERVKS